MEHNAIRHKLSDYIDGSITAEERNAIEEHLQRCSLCSNALRELQKTLEHIKTIEEVTPPAWITQKIMVNVRDASQKRKGLFSRWFLPPSIKLPIQAVAVLFLVVTAFYIFRNSPPSTRPSAEPPQESSARKEVPPASSRKNDIGTGQESAPYPSTVPQAPGYKALDMKPEYEKPAPPIPFDQSGTQAQIRQDERTLFAKKKAAGERLAAVPPPGAPPLPQERAAGAMMRPEVESRPDTQAREALNAASAEKVGLTVIMQVKDIEIAGRDVEQALTKLGGSITRRESNEAKRTYGVTIDAKKLPELKHTLKLIGEIQHETAPSASQPGRVAVTIELMKNQAFP
ncbi:MAG TPA: DUF2275 domain-containing protein [Nitrospirota bacterium]|nr:DUF2275 domain-containing protein [Nitrospirota bacterium]